MKISAQKLGLDYDSHIEILNLKVEAEIIAKIEHNTRINPYFIIALVSPIEIPLSIKKLIKYGIITSNKHSKLTNIGVKMVTLLYSPTD